MRNQWVERRKEQADYFVVMLSYETDIDANVCDARLTIYSLTEQNFGVLTLNFVIRSLMGRESPR